MEVMMLMLMVIGVVILSIAHFALVFTIIRPKVMQFDVFAHDGRLIDTVAAFSRRDVEKSFDEQVYVKKHEG
jgi:hypothetical protein